jgi:hypothetical protein
MKVSRAAVATVAACLTVGFAGAAPAMAAPSSGDDSAKAKSAQKRVSTRTLNRRLNTTRRQVTTATRRIRTLTTGLGTLTARVARGEGGLNLLLGAAPQLVNGLTTLGNVVRDQIGPGLTTLANTVRDTIGPGLQRVGDAVQAVEYGVAGLTLNDGAAGVIATGGQAISSDVPDDGNTAMAKGTAYIQSTAAGAIQFVLRGVIRSNEADNTAAQTVGQAGGFVTVKRVDPAATQADTTPITTYNQAGVVQDCADDDVTTVANNTFILGTPTGATIVTPTGNRTDLNLVNLPGGTARTDTAGPVASSPSLFPAALPQCTIVATAASQLFEVTYQVNFADIPTSTSPGPKD